MVLVEIKKISPLSTATSFALLNLFVYIILGIILTIFFSVVIFSTSQISQTMPQGAPQETLPAQLFELPSISGLIISFIIFLPTIAFVAGFVITLIASAIYNFVVAKIIKIKVDLEEIEEKKEKKYRKK